MRRYIMILFLFILLMGQIFGQISISSDNSATDPSAGLEVKSTTGGFLPPRMNKASLLAIASPANGLMIYCTDCGPGGAGQMVGYFNSSWQTLRSSCLVPGKPASGILSATSSSITWQWQQVAGATGYRWGASPNYNFSITLGSSTSYSETGLACNVEYTRYVWAENGCGRSDSLILTKTTTACTWSCGQNITDSRDNKEYMTIQIGTQCWFRQNLNVGSMINGTQNPSNNGTIEKYCYNDLSGNCNSYGGMYRWGEMVQYLNGASDSTTWQPSPSGNVQGICPSGWHIPTQTEWNTLVNYLGGSSEAGGKMKEVGQSHWAAPNTGATNSSGFTALPGGYRHPNGSFYNYNSDGMLRSLTQGSPTGSYYVDAGVLGLSYLSATTGYSQMVKRYGLYVRCIKDE